MQTQDAALIAAALATCGWIYTNRRVRVLSRKQHTVNVMLQASLNKEFREALAKISAARVIGTGGHCPDLDDAANVELKEAMKFVTNHLEFIAAGLRNGDFDERLVRDSQRSQFVETFNFFERHITKIRNTRHRMAVYEHVEWLVNRWTTKKPNGLQRLAERILEKPFSGKRVDI